MPSSYVLLTALPPTKGHLNLIRFAEQLTTSGDETVIVLATQPDEPFHLERVATIRNAAPHVRLHLIHRHLPQEPEDAPGFWPMWGGFLRSAGFRPGDYVVGSEGYGIRLAEEVGGVFIPYDPDRSIHYSKATRVREHTLDYFHYILPEFQGVLRQRVTIFGAESVGKTTLSKDLGMKRYHAVWLPEWARPYLETVGPDITLEKMEAIWHGQAALQDHADSVALDQAFIIQDTDLYSTIGYWMMKHKEFGSEGVPAGLVVDAHARKSDLYIVLAQKHVPFEEDPLRYGGDKRESSDQFWINLCEGFNLPYIVLDQPYYTDRREAAWKAMRDLFGKPLEYTRRGSEYTAQVDSAAVGV